MTDLKQLLHVAAGDDPAVTDADLVADLHRGRRARRRRRIGGVAGGATVSALVAVGVLSLLPAGPTALPDPNPAAQSPNASPVTRPTNLPVDPRDKRPPAPVPADPVRLVSNSTAFPGWITCDLVPAGWKARIRHAATKQQELYDPNLRSPGRYHPHTMQVVLRVSELMGKDLEPDKYGRPWAELPRIRLGRNEAVVTLGTPDNGLREIHVRQGQSRKVVVVANYAHNLGWDLRTVLRFAGSCRLK